MQQDGDQEDRDLLDLDNIEDQVEDTSGSALTGRLMDMTLALNLLHLRDLFKRV